MSLIQWPFVRHSYTGLNNPLFVSDIQAANEAVIDGLIALAGLSPNDFFIISGLTYTAGINGNAGTYSEGIYYLNGVFYHIDDNLVQEGLFLLGSKADAFNEVFPDDGNSRPIYTIYNGTTLSTSVSGSTSIQMSGDMNGYRLNNKYLAQAIINLQNAYNSLGNAAKLNVGQTAGTVAAGDDSRLVYNKAQLDGYFASFALSSNLGNAAKLNVGTTTGTVAAGDDSRFGYSKSDIDARFANYALAYQVGEVKYVYDINGSFAQNFDATGIGISSTVWAGWALCNGLNSKVPNLAGQVLIGQGIYTDSKTSQQITYASKQAGGEPTHTLTVDEMPSHTHNYNVRVFGGGTYSKTTDDANSTSDLGQTTSATGGDQPHNNMPPYTAVYIVMKYQ